MINRILKYNLIVLLVFAFASCNDVPLPYETFEDAQKGALARLLSTDGGSFKLTDVANSSFSNTMEYIGDVASQEWFASYTNSSVSPAVTSEPVLIKTINSFGTNAKSGLPEATVTITLQECLDALGLSASDVNGGDFIVIDADVITSSGTRFGKANSEASLYGAGFDGFFSVSKALVCDSDLAGSYRAATSGQSTDGCCPDPVSIEWDVTLTAGDGTDYVISDWTGGLYKTWYGVYGITPDFDMSTTITDACNQIVASFTEPFGTATTITGTVDPATGIITFSFVTGYDDVGTIVMTPN